MAKFSLGASVLGTLQTWSTLLRSLTFSENFKGQVWTGTIEAGEEKKITHFLKSTPTQFLILGGSGIPTLVKGPTAATAQFFYIKNIASNSSFVGKVLILP